MEFVSPKKSEDETLPLSPGPVIFYNFAQYENWSGLSAYMQQLKADILWLQDRLSQEQRKMQEPKTMAPRLVAKGKTAA